MSENIIEFKNVTKIYEGRNLIKALDSVSFSAQKGDIFGVVGDNDSGKTTLMKLFKRLEAPTYGNILYKGRDISEYSDEINTEIALIFEGLGLLDHLTVRENIENYKKLFSDYVNQADRSPADICGIEDLWDKPVSTLTKIQKVRVAIARSLIVNPEILLVDELLPEGNEAQIEQISALLRKINEEYQTTIFVFTRNMPIVEQICNQVLFLEKGHVAEYGNVRDIIKSPRSNVAKKLIYPENTPLEQYDSGGHRCIRIAFDGTAAKEPIIAGLVEETGEMVSILCANTKSIGGVGFGQMIVQLPDDMIGAQKALNYFKKAGVFVEEVDIR
ncbi:MAG: ATP-binding cassette domain-containing protein [Lachnospiraceae bacterium]|nr:ATP-binding cassette domain-containing protein [Lachnospiraceae bacterium]